MRVGLLCLGIGPFVGREWMTEAAQSAENRGFSSLFVGEHLAFFDQYKSPYPYLPGGDLPVAASAEIFDPLVLLTWLAAHTESIRLGTGVTLLGLHNPMAAAKRFASLDQLCGGRLVFGVGVGWSEEEYACAGVPWNRRWARMDDYIAAVQGLWSTTPSTTYHGEFVTIADAYSYPKPVNPGGPPLFFGGNGDMTLRRVARSGDGWLGMNLAPDEVTARIEQIRSAALQLGRDPAAIEMSMLTSQWHNYTADDYRRFADSGLQEMVVFGHSGPAVTPDNAAAWIDEVATRTVDAAAAVDRHQPV